MYACNGIILNHENPGNGQTFVTFKIPAVLVWISCEVNQKSVSVDSACLRQENCKTSPFYQASPCFLNRSLRLV